MGEENTADMLEDALTEEITALFGNETTGAEERGRARRLARGIRGDVEADDPEEPTVLSIAEY